MNHHPREWEIILTINKSIISKALHSATHISIALDCRKSFLINNQLSTKRVGWNLTLTSGVTVWHTEKP